MSLVELRVATPEFHRASEEVTRESFWNQFAEGADEHFLQHMIRRHSDYVPALDYVALLDGKVVGSITYSRSKIVGCDGIVYDDVVTFGPISVHPAHRKTGIAAQLILHTLQLAKDQGYRAVVIYGDARFYGRLGFRCAEKYDITTARGAFHFSLLIYALRAPAFDTTFSGGAFHESEVFENVDEEKVAAFDLEHNYTNDILKKSHAASQDTFQILITLNYRHDKSKYPSIV